ncbi:DamX, an inner membrane protein involved in bile resistance [Pseudoalteromonas luteoviolacea B = ATCC 29581]|nr:DamX, an inner membrane protein involved in bile resistance [Pseudoalteromonas luteoviolacea B = ATCC 29581]
MQSQLLPSRAALIDRIALQLEYGQNIITIVGSSGLGKSYLLESFITDKYPEFNKAFVSITANMTDNELMHSLLEHSFRAPLVDHKLSLFENFSLLAQQTSPGPCLWVLDGGRHLSQEMIEQIQQVVRSAHETLYVLISAPQAGMIPGALDMHIEPLTWHESKQLLRWYFKTLPLDEDPVFNAFVQSSNGNPTLLLSWQPDEQSTNLREKTKSKWHWHFLALTIVLALLVVGLLYKKELIALIPNKVAEKQEPLPTVVSPDHLLLGSIEREEASSEGEKLKDEGHAFVESDTQTALSEQQQPQQEIPSIVRNDVASILDALEAKHSDVIEPNAKSGSVEPAQLKRVLDENAPLTQSLEETSTDKPTETKSKQSIEAINHLINDANWYLSLSNSEWTIQVMAVTEVEDAKRFLTNNPELNAKVYPSLRQSRWWYVVTVGQFKTLAEAKLARSELPETVLQNQPFYKKVGQIQEEIRGSTR